MLRFASLVSGLLFFAGLASRCRVVWARVLSLVAWSAGGRQRATYVRGRGVDAVRQPAGQGQHEGRGPWSPPPPRWLAVFSCAVPAQQPPRFSWGLVAQAHAETGIRQSDRHVEVAVYPFCGHFLVLMVTEFVVARTRDTRGKNLTCCSTLLSDLRWHFRCSGSNRPAREIVDRVIPVIPYDLYPLA